MLTWHCQTESGEVSSQQLAFLQTQFASLFQQQQCNPTQATAALLEKNMHNQKLLLERLQSSIEVSSCVCLCRVCPSSLRCIMSICFVCTPSALFSGNQRLSFLSISFSCSPDRFPTCSRSHYRPTQLIHPSIFFSINHHSSPPAPNC